jgi:hypothetical protein
MAANGEGRDRPSRFGARRSPRTAGRSLPPGASRSCDRFRRAVRAAVRRRRTGTRPSACRHLHWYRPHQASGRDPSARCRIKLPPSSAR